MIIMYFRKDNSSAPFHWGTPGGNFVAKEMLISSADQCNELNTYSVSVVLMRIIKIIVIKL